MKKLIIFYAVLLLTSCAPQTNDFIYDTGTSLASESSAPAGGVSTYIPLNYTNQTALWIPYMRFADILQGKTEDEYRSALSAMLNEATEQGINTVYFHVHPNGDAYYDSDIFPRGTYWDGDYDPLSIAIEEAHFRGISLHAWMNPLRMQTEEQMSQLPDSFIAKKWADSPESGYIRLIGDRWYLVPVYAEVRDLVSSAAEEILTKYEIDGVHIDDYFYPTTDPSFDSEAFEASGAADLAEWRRDNVTAMVKSLRDTVHARGNRYKFGISPQGNIEADYEKLYADVELWSSDISYCDYIVPQIYFGFENETCPFEPTLRRWEELTANSEVSLIVGLAEYKLGKDDEWAGESGRDEWVTSPDILERQGGLVKSSTADGYAFYR
ncbi:MAG: family 10 glycosylhydrolase [Ruminococcus sp.]|nr:family 10 glycosylhydrolase [Ruminococcus sp.]